MYLPKLIAPSHPDHEEGMTMSNSDDHDHDMEGKF
jgi:hypothetical protein